MLKETEHLQFESRYYLAEGRRLQKEGMRLLHEADGLIEQAVIAWQRAREEQAG